MWTELRKLSIHTRWKTFRHFGNSFKNHLFRWNYFKVGILTIEKIRMCARKLSLAVDQMVYQLVLIKYASLILHSITKSMSHGRQWPFLNLGSVQSWQKNIRLTYCLGYRHDNFENLFAGTLSLFLRPAWLCNVTQNDKLLWCHFNISNLKMIKWSLQFSTISYCFKWLLP